MLPYEEMLLHRSPLEILRESEAKYRTLFESATDAVFLMSDAIIECNPQASLMFGYSRDELIGMTPAQLSPIYQPDGRASALVAQEQVRLALAGEVRSFPWRHQQKNGTAIDAEITLQTLTINGQHFLQATVRDITERNRQEQELKSSEQKFRQLFNSMSLGMALLEVVTDDGGKPCDYRYIDLNPTYGRFIDLEPQYAIGKTYSELNFGKPSAWLRQFGEVALTGIAKRGELTRGDSEYYEIYAYSPQQGLVANLVTDISASRISQRMLANHNAMLKTLSEYTANYLSTPFASIDCTRMAEDVLALSGSACVILNLYNNDMSSAETAAFACRNERVKSLTRLFDHNIVGRSWLLTDVAHDTYQAGRLRPIDNLELALGQQVDARLCRIVENIMGTGPLYGIALVHNGMTLGNLTLIYAQGEDASSPEVIEIFTRTIAAALARKRVEEALSLSEAKYRQLIEHSPMAISLFDLEGLILLTNKSMAFQHGYDAPEDLIGMSIFDLVAVADHENLRSSLQQRARGQVDRGIERKLLRKDGSEFFGEITSSVLFDNSGTAIAIQAISQNITERRVAEDRLRYMSVHDQLTDLYNRAYFEAELERLDASHDMHPVSLIVADLDGLKLVNDTFGHKRGDALLCDGADILSQHLRSYDVLARIGGDEFALILPQTNAEQAECLARQIRESIDAYNSSDRQLPLSFSLGIATSVSNATSLNDSLRVADDLMYRDKLYRKPSSRGQTVNALLAALAERDFVADGHASRMQVLCARLGEWVGLSSQQLADLSLFSQVHDLGKVGIPDHILFKQGPLNDEEWEIMREHPEKGYRIASASPALANVSDLILRHHERWDGKGYPLGLRGQGIPIECRILSIVDAYDAMTNDRPYRKALSHQEACAELKRCAGHQFDPYLIEAFLNILDNAS